MHADRNIFRRAPRARVAFVLALAATATASRAEAFCRRTVLPGDDSADAGCPAGAPLFHRSQCFPYRLFATEGPVPNVFVSDRLARALASWTTTNSLCFPGIRPVELAATNVDPNSALVTGRNIVGFPREWRYAAAGGDTGILGLTTTTFEVDNGSILAVHTELNPNVAWSWSDVPAPNTADVETVLFHEAGHMLGFAHSEEPDAVMFAAYELGTAKRTLSDDDRAAICAAYPTRAERSTATGLVPATGCELTPGTEASCADPDIRHGCSVSPSSTTSSTDHTWGILGLVPLGLVIRWKTRKRGASSAQP